MDRIDGSGRIALRLDMEGYMACPGIGELSHIFRGIGDHEVHVVKGLDFPAEALQHRNAYGDVRHEHTVHNVIMDPVCTSGEHVAAFVTKR